MCLVHRINFRIRLRLHFARPPSVYKLGHLLLVLEGDGRIDMECRLTSFVESDVVLVECDEHLLVNDFLTTSPKISQCLERLQSWLEGLSVLYLLSKELLEQSWAV